MSSLAADGDEGTRTPDLRLAKAPLSQLSYIPALGTVGLTGLEPVTLRLSGVRSRPTELQTRKLVKVHLSIETQKA